MIYGTRGSMSHSQGLSNNPYSEPNQQFLVLTPNKGEKIQYKYIAANGRSTQ